MGYDRPQRRSPRLAGYDYAQEGAYFVTICTQNRVCLFGEVVEGMMRPNEYGLIAERCWKQIPDHFPQVELDAFVVMPNHVHGIVFINDRPEDVLGTRHVSLPKPYTPESFGRPVAGSLSTIIRSYKSAVTQTINGVRGTRDAAIWQGRFHDHIIRSERALNRLRDYIVGNPALWQEDQLNLSV